MNTREYEQKIHQVYLTLISKSDYKGLVTQCTLTDLMDYASVQKNEEIQEILLNLERQGKLKISRTGTRKREFQLMGTYEHLRFTSTNFINQNATRVATIQNQRSKNYTNNRNLRERGVVATGSKITIMNVEKIQKSTTQLHQQWRFCVTIDDKVTIKDCILIDYPKPYVAGPNKGPIVNKESYVQFTQDLKEQIIDAMKRHIDSEITNTAI